MKRFLAGNEVVGGYYWNMAGWDIQTVSGERGVLEGAAGASFVKLPLVAMVPLAAVMSLGFVMFLPVIGFGMLVYAIVRPVGRLGESMAHSTMKALSPDMQPGAAYLAGKPREEGQEPGSGLEKLEDEVATAREREEAGRN